jgi:hypothetical protein
LETFEDGEAKWLANAVTPDFTCKASTEAIYVRTVQNFYKMPKDAAFMIDDRTAVIGGSDFAAYCQAVSRAVAAMLDEPVYDKIPQIRVPTLVLFGKHDELIPNPFLHGGSTERLAEKAIKRFPQAELVVLDKAGHMAQFEQPQAWNEAVLAFLARDPAPVQTGAAPRDDEDATEQVEPLYAPGTDPDAQPTDAPPAPVEPKSAPKVEPAPVEPTPAEPEAVPEPDSPPELEGSGE